MSKVTTNQLREKFAETFGRPATSRNREYLERKLAEARKEARKAAPKAVVAPKVAAAPKPEPKPAPAPQPTNPPTSTLTAENAKELAKRLTKEGMAVRAVCAELEKAGMKTARGATKWWPSSVQGLLRA